MNFKTVLGPVHLLPKTDKLDYLRSPIMKKIFVSCFDVGEFSRSPGKWNWNWLYFLPFIFTFEQGEWCVCGISKQMNRLLLSQIKLVHLNSMINSKLLSTNLTFDKAQNQINFSIDFNTLLHLFFRLYC